MIINNAKLIFPDNIKIGSLETEGGRISELTDRVITTDSPDVLDAHGMYLCPGFIDIHTHGGGGVDFLDDAPLEAALEFHSSHGTTSLLPTALTSPPELISGFVDRIRREMNSQAVNKPSTARILGAHIEGPYLSQKNKGAQPESCLRIPSRDPYDFLLDGADVIKTVTLSPELDGAPEMVRALKNAGITVCAGHDNGKKSTITDALDAGITHLTHTWCAMSSVAMYDGTREPGLLEIGLSDDRFTTEIIADDHHMPPELVKIVYRCKGAKRMCVVSDSLRAGGMPPDGRLWTLGREQDKLCEFIVSDGVARLPDNTRLAGSIQPLSMMVKNLLDCNIALHEAVRMASLTPAEVIGVDGDFGSLEVGKHADLCLLDEKLNVRAVFSDGVQIH